MSKPNKVNKSNYDQGGRLTPDDLARERKKQMRATPPERHNHEQITNRAHDRGERASNRPRTGSEE
jgi:hypothetical protein